MLWWTKVRWMRNARAVRIAFSNGRIDDRMYEVRKCGYKNKDG